MLDHGLADLSLRPLAAAVGSSPRVLLYLFGSKDGLVAALLRRARMDELDLLDRVHERNQGRTAGLNVVAGQIWTWLAAPEHRALLALWVEAYGRSLVEPEGLWADFAQSTVQDWLVVLAAAQPAADRNSEAGAVQRTLVLAVLRGALLDLLATGDEERVGAAVSRHLKGLSSD